LSSLVNFTSIDLTDIETVGDKHETQPPPLYQWKIKTLNYTYMLFHELITSKYGDIAIVFSEL